MAALQLSTAVNLLMAGANMLLMRRSPRTAGGRGGTGAGLLPTAPPPPLPAPAQPAPEEAPVAAPAEPAPAAPAAAAETPAPASAPPSPAVVTSAAIVLPTSFSVPPEKVSAPIRTVTLGGSGTRTSAVTLGGASALPFRHFEGDTGHRPAIAMEVFDRVPRSYPESLRAAYGSLLDDPAAMARCCVEEHGAEVISVRLEGAHPDNGDCSPEDAARVVERVLKAVGVPLIVTGPAHFAKTNEVLKQVASAFAGENLLLSWAETDNYKTIAAAAMAYNHCVVAQTPIDVNMATLNSAHQMGLAPRRSWWTPSPAHLGYGLEYLLGDGAHSHRRLHRRLMLAMMLSAGFEVAKTKESKAPASPSRSGTGRSAAPSSDRRDEPLNAGADLLIPTTRCGAHGGRIIQT